jgi:hypothetical protein
MRRFCFGLVLSASLAALPARASAEQVAYAWYQRTAEDRNLVDVYISAHEWNDGGGLNHYVSVTIDRYNWRLRDPVVESLRCELNRVTFTQYSAFPVQVHVDISDGPADCFDQHSNRWRTVFLRASWDLWDDGDRTVSAQAYVRATSGSKLYTYVAPNDPALSPDISGY